MGANFLVERRARFLNSIHSSIHHFTKLLQDDMICLKEVTAIDARLRIHYCG